MSNGTFTISYNIYYVPATKLCNKRIIFSQNIEKNNKVFYIYIFLQSYFLKLPPTLIFSLFKRDFVWQYLLLLSIRQNKKEKFPVSARVTFKPPRQWVFFNLIKQCLGLKTVAIFFFKLKKKKIQVQKSM